MSKEFDYSKLDKIPNDRKQVCVVQRDNVVYQAVLMIKHRFFFGWRKVADLMDPVLKIDAEIEHLEAALAIKKEERNVAFSRVITLINTVGNIYESKPFSLKKNDKAAIKASSFSDEPDKGKKVTYVELVGAPKPSNNNQGNGKNRNNSSNNNNNNGNN